MFACAYLNFFVTKPKKGERGWNKSWLPKALFHFHVNAKCPTFKFYHFVWKALTLFSEKQKALTFDLTNNDNQIKWQITTEEDRLIKSSINDWCKASCSRLHYSNTTLTTTSKNWFTLWITIAVDLVAYVL